MSKWNRFLSIFMLLAFCAIQLGAAHQLSHEEDDAQHCEMCLVIQHSQSQDFVPVASLQIEVPVSFDIVEVGVCGNYAFAKAESITTLHTTRPPPVNYV